jgi:DNA-3-methyladenine glycosylase I
LRLYEQGGMLDNLLWQFVDGRPRINRWRTLDEVPAVTPEATAMTKELKQRGFRFVGPTVMYAHMQATGMVNDHLLSCPRHAALGG